MGESNRMNSLKTIYSRITTMDPAKDALEEVGVGLYKIGENGEKQVKPVTQILNDLSDVWWTLTDAQRQNLGVTLAGRFQLSRFLGMMNNYDIAVDATRTAVTSYGSALRENAEYLDSYEAKMNQLKTAFTEFAKSVGDSILGDAMTGVIRGLISLADAGVDVVDKFGALPVLFLTISTVMSKMGVFDKLTSGVIKFTERVMDLNKTEGIFKSINTAFDEVVDKIEGTESKFANFGANVKNFLVHAGIGLAMFGVGKLIEHFVKARNEQKELEKEAEELNRTLVDNYRSYADGMESVISTYERLSDREAMGITLSTEEQTELAEATAEIANALPIATKYVDANGKAHLKASDEIREHVKEVQELSRAEAELAEAEFEDTIADRAKGLSKVKDNIADIAEEMKQLEKDIASGRYQDRADHIPGLHSGIQGAIEGEMSLNQAIQHRAKLNVEMMKEQAKYTEMLQADLRLVEESVLHFFEAENQLSKLSESQLSIVEGAVSINEDILRNFEQHGFKSAELAMMHLKNFGVSVGNTFIEIYDEMEARAGGDPLKLEDMKYQLDVFAQAIPKDLFDLGKNTPDQMDNIVKSMANVSEFVRLGHDDFEELRLILEDAGLTGQEAGYAVHRLSKEFQNSALDAQAFTDSVYNSSEGMEDMNDIIIESIDLTKELFGYTDEELNQISEFAGQLKTLHATYGEGYKEKDAYKDLTENLSMVIGTSTKEAEKNADVWGEVAEALSNIDWTSGDSAYKQVDAMEGLSKKSREMLADIIKHGGKLDAFTRVVIQDIHGMNDTAYDEIVKLAKDAGMEVNEYILKTGALFDEAGNLIQQDVGKSGIEKSAEGGTKAHKEMRDEVEKPFTPRIFKTVEEGSNEIEDVLNSNIITFDRFKQNLDEEPPMGAVDKLLSTLPEIGEGFQTEADLAQQAMGTIFEGFDFTEVHTSVGKLVGNTLTEMEELDSSAKGVENTFRDIGNQLSGAGKLSGGLEALHNRIKESLDSAKKLKKEIGKMGEDDAIKGATDAIEKLAKGSKKAEDNFKKLRETVSESGSFNVLKESILDIIINLKNMGTELTTTRGILSKFSLISSDNLEEFVRIVGLLAGNMASASTYGSELVSSQIELGSTLLRVSETARSLESDFKNMTTSIQIMFSTVSSSVIAMNVVLMSEYTRSSMAVALMRESIRTHLSNMVNDFAGSAITSIIIVRTMSDGMYKELNAGVLRMEALASSIPQKIGNAIVRNMRSASSAMDSLAKDMVSRFKRELGIRSPSRVFENLGGWVIEGLVNGLTGSDLTSLGKNVFSDFGGGALSSWDQIRSYLTVGSLIPDFGGQFRMTSPFGMRKNPVTGQWTLHAGTDYGASTGTPIRAQASGKVIRSGWAGGYGNMVEIQGAGGMTYRYAHNSRNTVRVGDVVGKGQVIGLVGSTGRSTGPHVHYEVRRRGRPINALGKFAEGGFVEEHQIAEIGEEGLEAVIPLVSKRRDRGLSLWKETGALLGIDPELIDILMPRNLGGKSGGFGGLFHALSGEFGGGSDASGGIDGGTSGILRDSTNNIINSLDAVGEASFTALKKKSSKKKEKVELDELYRPNLNERQITIISGRLKVVEERMKRISEYTLQYRRSLEQVIKHNNDILKFNRKELASTQKRNKSIEKQLNKLKNVSKHTEKQRKKYNELMQEYDSNISKIANLQGEIEGLINTVREVTESIFDNIVEGVIRKFNAVITGIEDRIAKIDFKLEVISLTEEDPAKQIELIAERGREWHRMLREYESTLTVLERRLYTATQKYGHDSEVALKIKEEMRQINKAIDDTTVKILGAEKEIRDIRQGIADDMINSIKEQYKKQKDIVIKEIDEMLKASTDANAKEMKDFEKAHKDKMDLYDKEIKKINEVYDQRIKAIDDQISEDDYQEQLGEYIGRRQELENQIALLSQNDTLDDRKRLADSQKELEDLQKEMDSFIKKRQTDLLKEQLNEQKDNQIKALESERDAVETSHEIQKERMQERHDALIEGLEKEKEAIETHYDEVIENEEKWAEIRDDLMKGNFDSINKEIANVMVNEKRWAKVREELMKGNFDYINQELLDMSVSLDQLSDGTFDTLSEGFAKYSSEVRKFVEEINRMISNINSVTNINPTTGSITPDGKINLGTGTTTEQLGYIVDKAFTNEPLSKPTPEKEYVYGLIQEFIPRIHSDPKQAKYRVDEILRKAKANIPLDAPTPEKQILYDIFQDIMKRNGAKFDTGGYTGDWSGNDGRMAILHKKELVLNENQTKDILSTAKIMDQIVDYIPSIKPKNRDGIGGVLGSVAVNNIYNLNVHIDEVTGDKKGGETVVDEIIKGVRKMKG